MRASAEFFYNSQYNKYEALCIDVTSFALQEYRRRNFNKEVWIPLRLAVSRKVGKFGFEGYKSEFYGAGSLAVPLEYKEGARQKLNWYNNGLANDHTGYLSGSTYHPADSYQGEGFTGLRLVIAQRASHGDPSVWHLHPDLIATLNLRHEGTRWLAADEGYAEVVRCAENAKGGTESIEIRAEFLKDYLHARGMALCVSTFADRSVMLAEIDDTDWTALDAQEVVSDRAGDTTQPVSRHWQKTLADGRFNASVTPWHEGGHPYGTGFAVFIGTRKDFDFGQSVPEISPTDEISASKREGKFQGKLLWRVFAELWRDQWVEPAPTSIRVAGDKAPPTCFYIVDAVGTRLSDDELLESGRWLWFNPAVINESLKYRGANLSWYTRDTGNISLAADGGVAFGVSHLGLVNAYAKDIAFMPVWQQRIWAGFNIAPDGGVSTELLQSQAEGEPAHTQAPEAFLISGRNKLDEALSEKFGERAFRGHSDIAKVAQSCHRFRALDFAGLLALAKDLARITADDLDSKKLQKIVPLEPNEKRGSLKSLERVIGSITNEQAAAEMMKPLFVIYELRLADAHLASSETDASLGKLGLDRNLPYILQGRDLLDALVSCLFRLAHAVEDGEMGAE